MPLLRTHARARVLQFTTTAATTTTGIKYIMYMAYYVHVHSERSSACVHSSKISTTDVDATCVPRMESVRRRGHEGRTLYRNGYPPARDFPPFRATSENNQPAVGNTII